MDPHPNGQQPSLNLSVTEPVRVRQAALAEGQCGGVKGTGLGAGKSKGPKLLLARRQNEIGREPAQPRRKSRPNRLTGLEGNQLVGHNPQKALQAGFDMAEWWHAVAFNDS